MLPHLAIPRPEPTVGDTSWFVHDRFGLFVHWGIYALPARQTAGVHAEWVKNRERLTNAEYEKYFDHFDPDLFDPRQWAQDARNAGMRYAIITTKHHDGFCLWDSALTDYKATNTPARRDLLREFVDAFRAAGLRIGFYHSLIDWHHSEYPVDGMHPQRDDRAFRDESRKRDVRKYAEYLHGQVRELLTGYGKIDVMWFDFSFPNRPYDDLPGKGRQDWQSERLVAMVRELQPGILVNNRVDYPPDFHTPERNQPRDWLEVNGKPVVWEACDTTNGSWGYDRENYEWKPPEQLPRMLVDAVSKGGNLLLNVGPTARGEFPPDARQTLAEIGEWTRRHGRAIYGASASPYRPPSNCIYTQRENRLYLHLLSWPSRFIHLEGLGQTVEYAQLLHDGSEVRMSVGGTHGGFGTDVETEADTVSLTLPARRPNVAIPVVELFLRG